MRIVHVFLPLSLIVVALAAACAKDNGYKPIANVEQIMETTVEPVAESIFNAAAWTNGVQVGGPKNDNDWDLIKNNAVMLAETGSLIMVGTRAKDQAGWMTRSQALIDAANLAAKAAEAKNTGAIFDAGTQIYQACTGCHLQYINPATVKPKPATP